MLVTLKHIQQNIVVVIVIRSIHKKIKYFLDLSSGASRLIYLEMHDRYIIVLKLRIVSINISNILSEVFK